MVVQDLACPGFGSVVQVLQTILKICMEIKEVQESAKRLHGRLSDIFSELVKMENEGNLPKTEVLDKYVAVLARSLDCIQRYQKKKLVYRVLRYRQMMDKIFSINEEVDMLFNVFHLASTAAMMDWKKQYYEDQRVQKEMMNSLVINSMEVMKGMDDSRKQQEALFALQFEKQKGDNQQDKEMERIVKTMEHTIVQASKATVGQLPAWYLPADEVKYEEEPFARGSFAFVYRGVWGHGTKVVVKCFNVEAMGLDEATMKTIKKEMDVWYKFNHPNVIKMFGASHVTSPPFIVCEAANGDLRQFFARSEANKQQMWRMLYEAALGLDYIHKMKVVHGDLKLNNILVSSDRHAKLSDFGLSSVRNSSTMSKVSNADETAGALRWRAPECLLKAPNFASDVYSFAMCIIEAISDGPPFHGLDDEAVRENLRAGNIPDRPEEMPDDVWKLVEDMTSKDPSKRISLAHVIKKLEAFDQHEFTEELPGGATYCSNCSSVIPADRRSCGSCGFDPTASSRSPLSSPKGSSSPKARTLSPQSSMANIGDGSPPLYDLIDEITNGSVDNKEQALSVLVHKCYDDEQRSLIEKANGVEIITSLVRNGRTFFTQVYALECLKWFLISGAVSKLDLNLLRDCIQSPPQRELTAVVTALQSGSDQQKEKAAIRCACIAITGNCDDLRKAGVVAPLVEQLRNGSDTMKLSAVEALRNLAIDDDDCRVEISQQGAIGPLDALLQFGTAPLKVVAAFALGNLAINKEANEIIVGKGTISRLVELLRSGTTMQKYAAAQALGNISGGIDTYSADVTKSAIAPLVALVRDGSDELKECAAFALGRFTLNKDIEDTLIREDAMAPLGKLLRQGTDVQKYNAAFALAKVGSHNDIIRDNAARDEAIPTLIALLESGTNDQKCNAASAIMILANANEANRVEIAQAGALPPLVALLRTGIKDEKLLAAGALGNLANDNDANRTEIAKEGAILPLISLLRSGTSEQKLYAAGALGNLANGNDGNRVAIARDGAIPLFVKNLHSGTEELIHFAVRALGNLAADNEKNRVEMAREGVIPVLIQLVRDGTNELKYLAAFALGNLADSHRENQRMIARADAIVPLVALVKDGTDQQKHSGAYALAKLVEGNEDVLSGIGRSGIVEHLVPLLRDGSDERKLVAAHAIRNLSEGNEALRVEIKRRKAVPLLVKLLHEGTDAQKEQAKHALKRVSPSHCSVM